MSYSVACSSLFQRSFCRWCSLSRKRRGNEKERVRFQAYLSPIAISSFELLQNTTNTSQRLYQSGTKPNLVARILATKSAGEMPAVGAEQGDCEKVCADRNKTRMCRVVAISHQERRAFCVGISVSLVQNQVIHCGTLLWSRKFAAKKTHSRHMKYKQGTLSWAIPWLVMICYSE